MSNVLPFPSRATREQEALTGLRHALAYLEREARDNGFDEIAELIAMAVLANDDELDRLAVVGMAPAE